MTDKIAENTDKTAEKTGSANNSIAEFAKATSVDESSAKTLGEPAKQSAVDKTTEVSPMDRGAEDELDGSAPPKDGETAESKMAKAPASADADEKPDERPEGNTEEEPKAENEADVEAAKDGQEIGAQIGRPDSTVTSNSSEKEAEPSEHVDLEKSA